MSATKPQITPKHIIIWQGKPFNNEVSIHEVHSLKGYAEQEKFDLETECRNQYGIPVEWVAREQRSALFSQVLNHRAERLKASGFPHHRCVDCGEASACTDKDCTKTEIECRLCHDGELSMTRPEYWLHNKAAVMRRSIKASSICCTFQSRINLRLTT